MYDFFVICRVFCLRRSRPWSLGSDQAPALNNHKVLRGLGRPWRVVERRRAMRVLSWKCLGDVGILSCPYMAEDLHGASFGTVFFFFGSISGCLHSIRSGYVGVL